jgi:flagellar assembly protein FliH
MTVRVIKDGGRAWRVYRFPPRSRAAASAEVQEQLHSDPAALQRALADGYQQGQERGYQEGLALGREAGQADGYERGLQDGLGKGLEEGRAQGRRVFDDASAPLARMVEEFRRAVNDYEQGRREQLLELVGKVAKQVIRCELTLNPAQLLTLAEEVLSGLPDEPDEVQILLNPEEYARIKDISPERASAWRLVPDERLALGECRVVTAQSEVDVGCQQRLDACMDTLADHLKVEV